MNQFVDRLHVRLWNRARCKYLHADEDGRGVSLRSERKSQNAAWVVHALGGDDPVMLLQSAAYGRYLFATQTPAPPGHRGFRTEQSNVDQAGAVEELTWKAIRSGLANDLKLISVSAQGTRCLRANGRKLKWHRGVTVEVPETTTNMLRWVAERIPVRNTLPPLPDIVPPPHGVLAGLRRLFVGVQPEPARTIRYVRADPGGEFNDNNWAELWFTGRSLKDLRNELSRLMNLQQMLSIGFAVCARCGPFARPLPMVIDLPLNNDTIEIVVFARGTPGFKALKIPNVDAPLTCEMILRM